MELPTSLYVAAGAIVISNLSLIWAVGRFIFKAGKFVANTEAGIQDAKETAVRAHKRLDEHERVHHV